MAKLDEIAELLTEELNNFEHSVNRMEKLKEFLMDYEVQADTDGIDHLLKGYNDSQRKAVEEQNKLLANVIYHIKKSISFPKWAIKLFWGFMVTVLMVLGYAIFQISNIPKKEQAAFSQGESNAVRHFERFIEETPEAGALYEEWRNPKGKK
ncbi:hypothetical protein L0P88_19760 [Muricauda sp. SCSIO 64092]|uniref:DUF6730 family protein n=1 Tax=Allomuricauda sp. SCSIO 64092 TaxID=2908842 RepID=UPI001FF47E1F|nr:DUF6730 family protein [Muricauda sp. SCSIO 64092]UOY06149.1 hypothetical protein L0P88_19760 [Muricauda sp. SCSIO 64092]